MTDPWAPLTGLALADGDLDRRAQWRADPGLLDRLLRDPRTAVVVLRGDRLQVRESPAGHLDLVTRPAAPADAAGSAIFLGVSDPDRAQGGRTAYVGVVQAREGADPEGDWQSLRAAGPRLRPGDAAIFATLLALANWHAAHGYCSRCGEPTELVYAGWVRRCPRDASEHFPRTDPAVIVAVVDDAGRLLLGRGRAWPEDQFSVLAGFIEPGESLAGAVAREVLEESGVRVTDVRYLGDQPWPFPSSLMIGATARAVTTALDPDPEELAEVRWMTRQAYAAALADGSIRVPGGISIARRLIERWLGDSVEAVAGRPVVEGWRPVR